jgi:hypothetical protein
VIRGTSRTDVQNGDPRTHYELLFGWLLRLPDEALVYPAHDYKGDTVSTIGGREGIQSAATGEIGRGICGADEQPQPGQPEDDGCGDSREHASRLAPKGCRSPWLGILRKGALELVGQPAQC